MTTTTVQTAHPFAASQPNPYAIADAMWRGVVNPNDEYADYEHLRPRDRRAINVIAMDIDPIVAKNMASYYAAKGEPWADAMAKRFWRLARPTSNDNRRAGRDFCQPRGRRAA